MAGERSDSVWPYPYNSDLHNLWGWGERIRLRVADDRPANKYDWIVFRPDRSANDSMARFSIKYAYVIRQIADYLDYAERQFEAFLLNGSEANSENFLNAISGIQERVETGAAAIAALELPKAPPSPRISNEEANLRAREALKGTPPSGKRWSIRKLAEAIGCSSGLISSLPAWQAYAEDRGAKNREGSVRPKTVAFSTALEATTGTDDAELKRLMEEQEVDRRTRRMHKKL